MAVYKCEECESTIKLTDVKDHEGKPIEDGHVQPICPVDGCLGDMEKVED